MQSLRVRYLGPTDTKGSRYKVFDSYGVEKPRTFSYDHSAGSPKKAVAVEYLTQTRWPNHEYGLEDAHFAGYIGNDTLYIFL